jgi:hypothetical protein
LCSWDSCDCNHMKIFKGKWLILSLFLTFVIPLLGCKMFVCFCKRALSSDNCNVCFRRKAFLKYDKASLSRCITIVFFLNDYFIGCCQGGSLAERLRQKGQQVI